MAEQWESNLNTRISHIEIQLSLSISIMRNMVKVAKKIYIPGEFEKTYGVESEDYNGIMYIITDRLGVINTIYCRAYDYVSFDRLETISDIIHHLSLQSMHYLQTLQFIVDDMLVNDVIYPKILAFLYKHDSSIRDYKEFFKSIIGG